MGTQALQPETIAALRAELKRLIDAIVVAPQGPNVPQLRIRKRVVEHLLRRYTGDDRVTFDVNKRRPGRADPSPAAPAPVFAADLVPAVTPTPAPIKCPLDMSSKLSKLQGIREANTARYRPLDAEAAEEAHRRQLIAEHRERVAAAMRAKAAFSDADFLANLSDDYRNVLLYEPVLVDPRDAELLNEEWVICYLHRELAISEDEIVDILMGRHLPPTPKPPA